MSSLSNINLPSTTSNEYHHKLTFRDTPKSDAQLYLAFNAFNLRFVDRPVQIFIKVGDTASSSNYDFKTELMNASPYNTRFVLRFLFSGDLSYASPESKSMKFISTNGRFDLSGFIDILFKTSSSPVFEKRETMEWLDANINDTLTNNDTTLNDTLINNETALNDTLISNDTLVPVNGTVDILATTSNTTTTTNSTTSFTPFFSVYYADLKEGKPSSSQPVYQAYYVSSDLVDGFDISMRFSSSFFPSSVYGSIIFNAGRVFEQAILNRTMLSWRDTKKLNTFETISGNVPKRQGVWTVIIMWHKDDKEIYSSTEYYGSYSPWTASFETDQKFGVGLIQNPVLTGGFITGAAGVCLLIYLVFSHILIWKQKFSYDESLLSAERVYGDIVREISESLYMTNNMVGPDAANFKQSKLSSSTSFRVCCLNNMTSSQINPLGMKCAESDDFRITGKSYVNDIRMNGARLNRNIPWENVVGGQFAVVEYLKTCPNMQIVLAPDMLDHVIGLGVSGIVVGVFFISLAIGYFMCLVFETLLSKEGGKILFWKQYLPSSLNLKGTKNSVPNSANSIIVPCDPVTIPVSVPPPAAKDDCSSTSSSSSSSKSSLDEVNNAIEELHKSNEAITPRSEKSQGVPIQPTNSSSNENSEPIIYDRPSTM